MNGMCQVIIVKVSTNDLITELYYRVYDDMHDEEPRYDPLLNDMNKEDKIKVLEALVGVAENIPKETQNFP